ncbi:MAG: hypothetical protein HYX52_01350 [Chloroflexi bacterium]|nr:hypothetical protein [Chloroflexota bacterium]
MHVADQLSAAEWKQIELLRAATPARRAALARSLTGHTLGLARRAIREANPGADADELRVRYVAAVYGQDLASQFQQFLACRRDAPSP